jgi:hypothetical protein
MSTAILTTVTAPPFGVIRGARLFAYCQASRRYGQVVGDITEVTTATDHYWHFFATGCCCGGHVRSHTWRPV